MQRIGQVGLVSKALCDATFTARVVVSIEPSGRLDRISKGLADERVMTIEQRRSPTGAGTLFPVYAVLDPIPAAATGRYNKDIQASRMTSRHGPNSPEPLPETSSQPSEIPCQQLDLFQQVLAIFEENAVPYAVAGAFALQAHTGICRDTKDLDLFLTAETVGRAFQYLRERGFDCEVCDPVWLYKARRGEFFVDLITGMSNGILAVESSWIERSVPAMVHGVQTRVLAAEELLASKIFVTRRERFDGADIAHVIYGTHGRLDWKRILSLAGENWEMLLWSLVLFRYCYPAHTDYVPVAVWQDLLGRFGDVISRPDPAARFRGSLVDERMFAIDIKELGHDDLLAENRERRLRSIPGVS